MIETNSKDYKKLYNTTNKLLGRIKHTTLLDLPTDVLFNNFENYFIDKIDKIYDKLTIKKTKLTNLTKLKYLTTNAVFSTFDIPTITEIYNLIITAKKTSPNDPLPSTITKSMSSTLAPLFKIIIDESLTYGTIPDLLKLSLITRLLKKLNSIKLNSPIIGPSLRYLF